jgi:hypothetical protein
MQLCSEERPYSCRYRFENLEGLSLFELWAKDVDESELMMVTNNALWFHYIEMPSFTIRSSGSDKHPILPKIISKHLLRYGKDMVDGVLLQTSMWLRRFDEQEADWNRI